MGAAIAQRPFEQVPEHFTSPLSFSADRNATDTLVPGGIEGGSFTVYTSTNGGYLCGTNGYGDKAKVQVFNSTGSVYVEQLIFLFAAKDENGAPNSPVHARVYALDGPGTNDAGTEVTTAPGTVLGSVDLPISACDTADITVVPFSPAIAVNGNFGGGFDFSGLASGVELGAFTSETDAPGTAPDMAWEKFSDDSWSSTGSSLSWGQQLDFGIIAVIGDGVAGIDDAATVNGMRMSFLGGNPASTNVIVAYEMLQDANAQLVVLDGKGAKVVDRQMGRTYTGNYQTSLDVSSWANGTYYVSLYANGNPITKKLVVKH